MGHTNTALKTFGGGSPLSPLAPSARYIADESGVVEFLGAPRLPAHRKDSAAVTATIAVRCASCNAVMAMRKLANHSLVAHGKRDPEVIVNCPPPRTLPSPSHAGDATGKSAPFGHFTANGSGDGGADPLDGSRGLGHFARERGRFGSMPTHDDYGDEARA